MDSEVLPKGKCGNIFSSTRQVSTIVAWRPTNVEIHFSWTSMGTERHLKKWFQLYSSKNSPSDITKDNPVKILKAAFGISLSNIVSTACNNPSKCFESSRRQDVQSRFNDSDETSWKSFLQLFSFQKFQIPPKELS